LKFLVSLSLGKLSCQRPKYLEHSTGWKEAIWPRTIWKRGGAMHQCIREVGGASAGWLHHTTLLKDVSLSARPNQWVPAANAPKRFYHCFARWCASCLHI